MKFTIPKSSLFQAVTSACGVISSRSALPILTYFLLEVRADGVAVTATDLDRTLHIQGVPGAALASKSGGRVAVPAQRLRQLLSQFPEGDVLVEVTDKHRLSFALGPCSYQMHGLPPEEFPPAPELQPEATFAFPSDQFLLLLDRVAYCASTDPSRYVLNGVSVCAGKGRLTLVATDGRRLALAQRDFDGLGDLAFECILPSVAVSELRALLKAAGEDLTTLRLAANLAQFQAGQTTFTTKLVEGAFPNYKQVIPETEKQIRIALPRAEFLACLRRASIMATEKCHSLKLSLAKNNLTITAQDPEVGQGREHMAINYTSAEIAIAFNPDYVVSAVNALPGDEVFLALIDDLNPGVLRPADDSGLCVIMPMRLS